MLMQRGKSIDTEKGPGGKLRDKLLLARTPDRKMEIKGEGRGCVKRVPRPPPPRLLPSSPKSGGLRKRPFMTTRAENSRVARYGPNILGTFVGAKYGGISWLDSPFVAEGCRIYASGVC